MTHPANPVGKDKFNVRRREEVWWGIRLESGESIIGTSEGVVKAKDCRRKPESGGRWSLEKFDMFVGAP